MYEQEVKTTTKDAKARCPTQTPARRATPRHTGTVTLANAEGGREKGKRAAQHEIALLAAPKGFSGGCWGQIKKSAL